MTVLQEKEGLKYANKITSRHINFHKQKMKVKLAAQLLSSSVAVALDVLRCQGWPQFQDSEGTVEFVQLFDK